MEPCFQTQHTRALLACRQREPQHGTGTGIQHGRQTQPCTGNPARKALHAHAILLVDNTLLGSTPSLNNHKALFESFCDLSPAVKSRETTVVGFSTLDPQHQHQHQHQAWHQEQHQAQPQHQAQTACPRQSSQQQQPGRVDSKCQQHQTLSQHQHKCQQTSKCQRLPFQHALLARVDSILSKIKRTIDSGTPVVLYLAINGHSHLYRDGAAQTHAQEIGETPFLARDGTTIRFSTVRYKEHDVLTPSGMSHLLDAITRTGISRSIVFLDTCHSMSLVSTLLCPAADVRIIHSTGEEEKTWQARTTGSLMSRAWRDAARGVFLSQAPPETALWTTTQAVAQAISSQVLTTGPGQALSVF